MKHCIAPVLSFALTAGNAAVSTAADALPHSEEILALSGVDGGLVVVIGCPSSDAEQRIWEQLTQAVDGPYSVQLIDTEVDRIDDARKTLRAKGIYGKVSAITFDGKQLPYIANLVNLLVVNGDFNVERNEIMRVLAPLGVAWINGKKTVKPWPGEIDEWTHYLHGPDNNAVAADTVVAPPCGMQWMNGPLWDRAHSTLPAFAGMVSARGRIFTIEDRAPISLPAMAGKYALVARDAFSGIELWKHPLPDWENITHHFKGAPPQLNRRVVAAGDTVYATPGITAPVVAFDAASGRILRRYEETEGTQEIILYDGVLYLAVGDQAKNFGYRSEEVQFPNHMAFGEKYYAARRGYKTTERLLAEERDHAIVAVDTATGRTIWRIAGERTWNYEGVSLAVDGGRLVYQAGKNLFCVDRNTGEEVWQAPVETSWGGRSKRMTGSNATIVMRGDIVYRVESDGLKAYALDDARLLWQSKDPVSFGYMSSPDLFIAADAVWVQRNCIGFDPLTGEPVKQRGTPRGGPMGHDRCHRNKATERFIIESASGGNDFSYLGSEKSLSHPWVRNTCSMGGMPCNGLLYATPHACGCVNETTLNGVWALTGARKIKLEAGQLDNPLVKGVAYNNTSLGPLASSAWPTYRRDPTRSGLAKTRMSPKLDVLWEAKLPAASTQPTIAGGTLYVSVVDAYTVYALDASSGEVLWSYCAGGRVDTPPTYYKGLVLFGSRDGWVYCLRASDGALAWKFRAAPRREHLACAFDRVESLWPVRGSVLILNDVAYVSAGRSTFLDGGMVTYALDPLSGKKLYERVLAGPYEDGGEPIINPTMRTAICGNKNEILVTDGKLIYLSYWAFTPELQQVHDRQLHEDHLMTGSFMLDDAKHHRSYWTLSVVVPADRRVPQVAIPDGDLIAMEDDKVYGIRVLRTAADDGSVNPVESGFSFFSMTRHEKESPSAKPRNPRPGKRQRVPYAPVSKYDYVADWNIGINVNPDAMLLDEDHVFVAGTPNVYPDDDIFKAIEGRMGGLLVIASKEDGHELAKYHLDAVPTWDGMSAADGKLFVSLKNGSVICYRKEKQ